MARIFRGFPVWKQRPVIIPPAGAPVGKSYIYLNTSRPITKRYGYHRIAVVGTAPTTGSRRRQSWMT